MKELTRIITAEITGVVKVENVNDVFTKEEAKKIAIDEIKKALQCDDVVITKVQDFVIDMGECNEQRSI